MIDGFKNYLSRWLKRRHPFEYSQITDDLYVAAWPVGENVGEIVELGVRLVINMDWLPADPKLSEPPLRLLALETHDSPLTPMPLGKIRRGVDAALETMAAGGKVMVYCKGGVHRSAVMACCILVAEGRSAHDAIRLVKEQRPTARPDDTHYRKVVEQFAEEWGRVSAG